MMDDMKPIEGERQSPESTAETAAPVAPKKTKAKAAKVAAKPAREQSAIAFPYMDLAAAVSVVQSFMGAGGVALTREQLAGVMGQSVTGGSFVMKLATARIFGLLTTNAQGKLDLTSLGSAIVDSDDRRQKAARAEAFLKVPLYSRAYEEFRGRQLPPRPNGLEQAFVAFGVPAKQKAIARQVFDRSAQDAGFFPAGPDRLIEPILNIGPTPVNARIADEAVIDTGSGAPVSSPVQPTRTLHPFVQGLLDTLPEPQTNWTVEGRAKWLQAAANIFDLIYKGDGEIAIVSKAKGDAS